MAQYPPIMPDKQVLLHGGDYNPEQWIKEKDTIWPIDMALAKKAGVNTLSVGIFSWSMLEPEEGVYHFEWLDEVMDMLAANGIKAILATPSGARPAWMAEKYPEVLRVDAMRHRQLFGTRHNHCLTSPVYREKVRKINTLLAQRYKDHPALGMWHISNEYGGECHCPLCQDAFRKWLKERYGTIEKMNDAFWNTFWSHRYSSFDQVDSPSPIGESCNLGLSLAWRRFTSDQFCDFYSWEIEPLKRITPNIPCTANLMDFFPGIDYFKLGKLLDRASWDNYPPWAGDQRDKDAALHAACMHDIIRGVGGQKPFMMMESSPSAVNWHQINRLRQPGVLMLQSLQAIAHGSDTVQYFQFRKGRGSSEQYHGAIIGHDNSDKTRTYKEVSEVGETLAKISEVTGSAPESQVALLYDWDNFWILNEAQFGHNDNKKYIETVKDHYAAWKALGYNVDMIDQSCDLSPYRIVCGPMQYLLHDGFAEKVDAFVKAGGTYVATYITGWVDEENLAFLGGYPGPLRETLGIWDEETDALDDTQHNAFLYGGTRYACKDVCALVHPESAQPLAVYEENFYKGMPALTRNICGKGHAYYIAARTGRDFLRRFYGDIAKECGLSPLMEGLPDGVLCTERVGDKGRYLFVMNTQPEKRTVSLPVSLNLRTDETMQGEYTLSGYEVLVLKRG
ncbi:MAG: beta-galactosidase [Clostridia bacterium]|nr:beta-galactosidase [Clostridia bacterium]